jgi:chorismate mutase
VFRTKSVICFHLSVPHDLDKEPTTVNRSQPFYETILSIRNINIINYMYTCIYVYMHICIHVYMYTCIYL